MAGERVAQRSQTLFLRHLSLYTDRADDDGIYPRYRPGADPKALTDTLSSFYANIVLYDLTWQWIFRDAPFAYEFGWLSQTRLRTHSQKSTVAARAMADRKTFGHRS